MMRHRDHDYGSRSPFTATCRELARTLPEDTRINLSDVATILGISHTQVRSRAAAGWLPKPISQWPTRWKLGDVLDAVRPPLGPRQKCSPQQAARRQAG